MLKDIQQHFADYWTGYLIIIFIISIFTAGAHSNTKKIDRLKLVKAWPEIEATVESAKINENITFSDTAPSRGGFFISAKVSFIFEGKPQQASFPSTLSSIYQKEIVKKEYSVGSSILIKVNPEDPSDIELFQAH